MGFYKVTPTTALNGNVTVPGSKSQTARGLLLGTLAEGTSHVLNPMTSLDNYSIANCCRLVGAEVDTTNDNDWVITSPGWRKLHIPAGVLDVGNSGTGFYFLTTLAALLKGTSIISGDYQICYRPIAPLLNCLREMGAKCTSTRNNELAPLVIEGPIEGGHTVHLGGKNVQWGIGMFVCCPALDGDTTIVYDTPLGERPYANLTMDWMKAAGVHMINNNNYESFTIPGNQEYHSFTKRTACDWCSASYPMVAAAIMKEKCTIRLDGMDINDFMGERHYVDWINEMGGKVTVVDEGRGGVFVEGGHELHGIDIDCGDTPDAVPALAVLGCYAQGKMKLYNVAASRMKETDRTKTITEELRKMGAHIEEEEDSITVYHSKLHGATIDGHHDHRIVMATSCAALGAEGETIIDSIEHVGVSFPRFYEEMTGIGAKMVRLIEK